MKRISLILLICNCIVISLFAQTKGSITGKVLDADGQAISYANVVLHAATDSNIVKLELTDDDGKFKFLGMASAKYYINVSFVGMPEMATEVFAFDESQKKEITDITLKAAANDLQEVTVKAKRPMVEMKPDRMVFNVDGSVNAVGSDALELLRKAPGVIVDNNENVTLLGRTGVRIYIDDKPSPLGAADLAAFLKTIQSSEIDAIEIITNPSSKYDAEGTAGIINIKLKKDKKLGANANINLGYSIGNAPRYNGTITTNYRNKKLNLFGTYSYNNGDNPNWMSLYREQFGFAFDTKRPARAKWQSHNYKVGADWSLNKRHTIGVLLNGGTSDNTFRGDSRTLISRINNTRIDSVLVAISDDESQRNNNNYNLNYRFDIGKGSKLNVDFDYGQFRNRTEEDQPNKYYDGSETEMLRERNYYNSKPTDIDIYTAKADYEMLIGEAKIELGAKTAYVITDNIFDFYNVLANQRVLDEDRSNQFQYTENVNAAYANYSKQFGKWGVQAGLRLEQTNSEGKLTSLRSSNDDNVKRSYVDWFPSGGLTYKMSDKNNFQLIYSRRINRPSYQDLNPFESRLDELTFEKGNAFLNPEYTHKVALSHSWNYMINTSFSFSHTTDLITRITDAQGTSAAFITWLNLAEQQDYSLNVSGAIPITKWWTSYNNLTGFHRRNNADFGDGKIVDLALTTFNVYSQNTFKLPKDISLELSGWYVSPSIWGGNFRMNSQWSIDLGLQKKLFDGRANLKLALTDIFKTNEWTGDSQFGQQYMRIAGGWDSRRVRINFSYLLGNNQVKSRKRNTGLEDEKSRIKSGN